MERGNLRKVSLKPIDCKSEGRVRGEGRVRKSSQYSLSPVKYTPSKMLFLRDNEGKEEVIPFLNVVVLRRTMSEESNSLVLLK